MSRLGLNDVNKSYPNGVRAVCHFSLDVQDGEFFVLVGPSGCGKTTTLRLIAGLEQPTSGRITFGTKDVTSLPPATRDVAMVVQNAALYPHLSVFENLAFGLKTHKLAGQSVQDRVHEVADALSITALLKRRPAELSGGERRRVAIGRAIVRAPKVFLFDEPLTDLDPPLRRELRMALKEIQRRLGVTTIYVTHDQAEAMSLADRIGVLKDGALQQIGTPEEIYRRPASPFVAAFFGEPGMNLIRGVIVDGMFQFELPDQDGEQQVQPVRVASEMPSGPAILGVRPGDWSTNGEAPAIAEIKIERIERFGDYTLANFNLGSANSTIRLSPKDQVRPGDHVKLHVRPEDLHFFSVDGDRRLN